MIAYKSKIKEIEDFLSERYYNPSLYNEDYIKMLMNWSSTTDYGIELKTFISYLKLKSSLFVLDIGCGTGRSLSYFRNACGCVAVGIDIPEMWKYVSSSIIVSGFAENLPYGSNIFDVVTFIHSIGHLKNVEESLIEAKRVLKKGGKIGILTPNLLYIEWWYQLSLSGLLPFRCDDTILRYFDMGSLVNLIKENGFEINLTKVYGKKAPRGGPPELLSLIAQA